MRRIAGSSASMRELVSTTITTESGAPPMSKPSIFCCTPLSKMRKFFSSRSSTNSPLASRTTTGVFTRFTLTRMDWSGALCCCCEGPSGASGPAAAGCGPEVDWARAGLAPAKGQRGQERRQKSHLLHSCGSLHLVPPLDRARPLPRARYKFTRLDACGVALLAWPSRLT